MFVIIILVIGLSLGLTQKEKTCCTETKESDEGAIPNLPRPTDTDYETPNLPHPVIVDEDYGEV